jgi:hypothetical protein
MLFTHAVLVLRGPMLEAYPSKLLNTTVQMIMRDFSKWKLGLDIRLIAVMYSVSSISHIVLPVSGLFFALDKQLVLNLLHFSL